MKRYFNFIFLIALFLSPSFVFGAEIKFYEFSSNNASVLDVAKFSSIVQTFRPYDDYISGFDVWLENSGEAGTAKFDLKDSENKILASKTVNIPFLSSAWGGKKLHVSFNNSVQVTGNNIYKLVISSDMPELKIFYLNAVQLVEHSGNIISDRQIGELFLDNQSYDFVLKFALYKDNALATSSTSILNSTSTVPLPLDGEAPQIFNARVADLTQNSAKIAWQTDEAANSSVLVSLDDTGSRTVVSIGDATYELEHAIETGGVLKANTRYYASIISIDVSGNISMARLSFNTSAQSIQNVQNQNSQNQNQSNSQNQQQSQNVQPSQNIISQLPAVLDPAASSSINVVVSQSGSGGATVNLSWPNSGSMPSGGYRADIFSENDKKLIKQTAVAGVEAKIDGLGEGDYYAVVYQNNNGVLEKVSGVKNFVVPAVPKSAAFSLKDLIKTPMVYLILIGALIILSAIVLRIFRKKKVVGEAGFTLMEVVIGMGILVGIVLAILFLFFNISDFSGKFWSNLEEMQEIQMTLADMEIEMRAMGNSSIGGYPIEQAGTSTLSFYSDYDNDGLYERIRYYLNGDILTRGILKPTGNPLVYNPISETTQEMVHNIANATSSIFTFYDLNGSLMSYPMDILDINMVNVKIFSQHQNQTVATVHEINITPRNLRQLR